MNHLLHSRKVYLIGMMGSGKSYWASRIGQYLGLPSFDLDKLIEASAGKAIKDIFAQDGEVHFRQLESKLLKEVPADGFVLACGGGTPCFFDNMDFMKENGLVIWLNPGVAEMARRISWNPGTRPVVGNKTDEELKAHLTDLLAKRSPWYSQAAIVIVEDIPQAEKFFQKITLHAANK
jgi:shikimate kinase